MVHVFRRPFKEAAAACNKKRIAELASQCLYYVPSKHATCFVTVSTLLEPKWRLRKNRIFTCVLYKVADAVHCVARRSKCMHSHRRRLCEQIKAFAVSDDVRYSIALVRATPHWHMGECFNKRLVSTSVIIVVVCSEKTNQIIVLKPKLVCCITHLGNIVHVDKNGLRTFARLRRRGHQDVCIVVLANGNRNNPHGPCRRSWQQSW